MSATPVPRLRQRVVDGVATSTASNPERAHSGRHASRVEAVKSAGAFGKGYVSGSWRAVPRRPVVALGKPETE